MQFRNRSLTSSDGIVICPGRKKFSAATPERSCLSSFALSLLFSAVLFTVTSAQEFGEELDVLFVLADDGAGDHPSLSGASVSGTPLLLLPPPPTVSEVKRSRYSVTTGLRSLVCRRGNTRSYFLAPALVLSPWLEGCARALVAQFTVNRRDLESKRFNSVYLYSAFYNKTVCRCFTEAETQSQNPQGSTVARKNSLLTGRNLEQDPAYREEPSC